MPTSRCMSFEVGDRPKDGKPITVQLRGVPLESLKGDETFCKIAITDITERKMVEEAIRASEANYRAVFDTANDAIFVHDAETGAILDANQKATEMYGYTAEEFRQASVGVLSEGVPPYSKTEAIEFVKKARDGSPQLFTWKSKDKAGRFFWTEVNLKRTLLNGQPRLLAIVRDITERKEAEEALRESEERFRTVADYTYDWEAWRGPDKRYRYISPSCQRITGYSPEEFIADPALLERIIHPDDRKRMASHLRRESPTSGPFIAEFRIVTKGRRRTLDRTHLPTCVRCRSALVGPTGQQSGHHGSQESGTGTETADRGFGEATDRADR